MSKLLQLYTKYLHKYPVPFQAIQTGVLMGTGDVIAQTFIEKKTWPQYSFKRTVQFAAIGTIFVGPMLTKWYGLLHRKFGAQKFSAAKKVAADQILMAPFINSSVITLVSLTQGLTFPQIKQKLDRDFVDILKNNYKVWPAVQMFNFYMVPLHYQVLVVQVVAICWNTYLSWKVNTNPKSLSIKEAED